jgi:hypothetical protein
MPPPGSGPLPCAAAATDCSRNWQSSIGSLLEKAAVPCGRACLTGSKSYKSPAKGSARSSVRLASIGALSRSGRGSANSQSATSWLRSRPTPGNFQNHLSRRWAEGCATGRDLLPEIKCLGYTGSLSHLERLLSQWRRAGRPAGIDGPAAKTAMLSDPSTGNLISPIVAAALCIKPRGLLTEPQAARVDAFKATSVEFATMHSLWRCGFAVYCVALMSRTRPMA